MKKVVFALASGLIALAPLGAVKASGQRAQAINPAAAVFRLPASGWKLHLNQSAGYRGQGSPLSGVWGVSYYWSYQPYDQKNGIAAEYQIQVLPSSTDAAREEAWERGNTFGALPIISTPNGTPVGAWMRGGTYSNTGGNKCTYVAEATYLNVVVEADIVEGASHSAEARKWAQTYVSGLVHIAQVYASKHPGTHVPTPKSRTQPKVALPSAPNVPGATLTPNQAQTYTFSNGTGQKAYLVSYSDGATGFYFVATAANANQAGGYSAAYFLSADKVLEGGTLDQQVQGGSWVVFEQGGSLFRVSGGFVVGNTARTLTVLDTSWKVAYAHAMAWSRAIHGNH